MSDNPEAFPVSTIDGFTQYGMTLRDYFAGQALAGMAQSAGWQGAPWDKMSADAYKLADAMLAAREAKP